MLYAEVARYFHKASIFSPIERLINGGQFLHYSINSAVAIFDIIDDDIVIIHLKNGNYYNISDTGAFIWKQIAKNTSFGNMLFLLRAKYNVDPATSEIDLQTFLTKLEAEGLVLKQSKNEAAFSEGNSKDVESENIRYVAPAIDVYRDMQDFLLVDPIHEVDEQGLPKYTPPTIVDD